MIIKLPFKTPTINHLYWHKGNMKILKKEAKELRLEIEEIVAKTEKDVKDGEKLSVKVKIYEDWLNKDNTVKKKDLANREKFLVDSVFKSLGIDDKYIWDLSMRKVQSFMEEKAEIIIEKW